MSTSSKDSGAHADQGFGLEIQRRQIAAEIHDGLLPYLFAAAATVAAKRRKNPDFDHELADVAFLIDQARDQARRLMSGIAYPPEATVDPLGEAKRFLESIDWTGDADSPRPKIVWGWPGASDQPSPLAGRLPAAVAVAVYRIVIESVRNAVRHANATSVRVSVTSKAERGEPERGEPERGETAGGVADSPSDGGREGSAGWVIEVGDDGSGFRLRSARSEEIEPEEIGAKHGLDFIRHRAAAAGLEIDFDSEIGRGTRVVLTIDLAGPAGATDVNC